MPGTSCNLSCEYCFEHKKGIKNKPGSCVSLSSIRRVIDESKLPVNIVFHGGEPLLASADYYRQLLSGLRASSKKIKAVQLQTNGTLLTQKLIDLFWNEFADLNIEISISLDGNEEMNKYRRQGVQGTWQTVVDAFHLLKDNDIYAGLLSVIHRDTLLYPKEYVNFLDSLSNIRFVKLNPLHLVDSTNKLCQNSVSPMEYAEFVITVFKFYVEKRLYKKFPMEPCLSIIQSLLGLNTHYCNYNNRKCINFVCLYPDDRMSLCDSLPYTDFRIRKLDDRQNAAKYLNEKMKKCLNCRIVEFCHGGCMGIRYLFKDCPDLLKDYCASKEYLYFAFSDFLRNLGER